MTESHFQMGKLFNCGNLAHISIADSDFGRSGGFRVVYPKAVHEHASFSQGDIALQYNF